ncbi:MAG: nuclear transport factor 2 family protein [Acidobacteria bacterium]|nr:nuclear transport factor 2 family protein [Acidobacteriota bacterium]
MSEQDNVQVVREIFEAFGRRDIGAMLERFHDQITWEPVMGAAKHVPMSGKRVGKEAVVEFFRLLDEHVTFDRFEPQQFIAQGDQVVTLGHYEGRAKATGRTFEADWAMVNTVRNGKITSFREYVSTSAIDAAFDAAGV